jgi:hypothetical protein
LQHIIGILILAAFKLILYQSIPLLLSDLQGFVMNSLIPNLERQKNFLRIVNNIYRFFLAGQKIRPLILEKQVSAFTNQSSRL